MASTERVMFYRANSAYLDLIKTNKKHYRHHWISCIKKYERIYNQSPSSSWAPISLYRSGELYRKLYKYSKKESDIQNAIDIYEKVIIKYPKSRYKDKALNARNLIMKNNPVANDKNDEKTKYNNYNNEKKISDNYSDKNYVTGFRYWSNPNYTRIVIEASQSIDYSHRLLKKDTSNNKPQRLYVDLKESVLKKDINKKIPINDNLLIDVRAGQYKKNTVRVVADIKSYDSYNVFSLTNPFRIVIDVKGKKLEQILPENQSQNTEFNVPETKGSDPTSLVKQLSLGVKTIIIDPGHGGRDCGATGYYRNIKEKDIVLSIAKKLATAIRQEIGCNVELTRNKNRFVSLEERTAIANTKNADLFISLHTNASRNKNAYGIETFILNFTQDSEAISVAARENATSEKNISDLKSILKDLMRNTKIKESYKFAKFVHSSIIKKMKKKI